MIFVDYETRSLCNLPAVGSKLYAEHPSTEILMAGIALDGQEPFVVPSVGSGIDREEMFVSWGRFDYQIYRALEKPDFPETKWVDAMALARYTGMPAGLNDFATALGFGIAKDPRGKRLINKYCIPKADGTFERLSGVDLAAMEDYCRQDVALLQKAWGVLGKLLPEWRQYMEPGYRAVERMNDNGVPIDRRAAENALEQCKAHEARLVEECVALCGFRPSQNLQIAKFLGLSSCTKQVLEDTRFHDPTQERVRQIRLESAKAATKKLVPMLELSASTGRAYGCLVPNGAHTGRGSSRHLQLHNMKRAVVDPEVFRRLHAGEALDEPLRQVQENIRGFIHNPEKVLVTADYAQVEARIVAWLAKCPKMLEAFMDPKRDIYREFASRAYSKPTVTDEQRTFGKIVVLGAGYGAGGKALATQAKGYGLVMAEEVGVRLKKKYADEYPEVPLLWDLYDRAAVEVVSRRHAGEYKVGPVSFGLNASGKTLEITLPSGRKLRFLQPKIVPDRFGNDVVEVYSRHGRRTVWGGHWLENVCQAVATDLKLDVMHTLNTVSPSLPIFEVHDELVLEVPPSDADDVLKNVVQLMEATPLWMTRGLIRAEGKVMPRYSK